MHISVPVADMPIELLNITPVNPLISKCQIKVCYVSDEPNRNRSVITKETAKGLANSIPGSPIVGYFNEAKGDFEEHNKVIEIANGQFKVSDKTRPYGFVSMDAPVWFQWFEDDGVQHEYLMTEGYIWTGQYPESQRIIDEGNNQSMELDEKFLDAYWTKDYNGKPQFFIINEAIMSKLCILGEDVEPCFEGASITKVQFSFEDSFKEKLFSMIQEMQEMLNKGGTPVFNTYAVEIGDALWSALYGYLRNKYPDGQDAYCSIYAIEGIYEEGSQKFAVLRDRNEPAQYFRMNFEYSDTGFVPSEELIEVTKTFTPAAEPQFATEAVEAYAAQLKVAEETPVADPVPEEEPAPAPAEEEPVPTYTLEEIPEYVELNTNYAAAQARITELEEQLATLTAANTELTNFKVMIETEKKQNLINSFYMLSDEDKKDCQDNIATYSYDDIEAKLSVICVRNKVSFNLENDENDSKNPTVVNIHDIDNEDAGLPAWVQRVKEVEKTNNF